MYRGRGPSKATPANVQCQKCLKRGHYSYECKASTQERPYIPRPSRTQQLFNPKLLPKLQNAVPEGVEKKKGVADQELAKKEAERARKRELERDDETSERGSPPPRRRRSISYDSVSSISTRSPSPPPRRSPSPPGKERSRDDREFSPRVPQSQSRSLSPEERYARRSSQSPVRQHQRRYSPYSRSPSPRRSPCPPPSRWGYGHDHGRDSRGAPPSRGSDRDYTARRAYSRSRSRSRSPARSPVRRDGRRDNRNRQYRDRDDDDGYQRGSNVPPPQQRQPPPPPRERSLSPFSKRLALTQAMNK
ncbi:zinc knuckle-domain-containing protein [Podospora australis]|uniref:Zinc knuckle-domain-containing protein n=1 Tax=Podospora australis TaxID=1536484 RepID=A0AAN6X1Z7_9PEZI|nr:zinc knuckle-domain-containing protein [Podospora australis]